MNSDQDPSSSSNELENKVNQLQQEISRLQAQLHQKNTPTSSVQNPISETLKPKNGLIKNSWLITFGQFLLLEPDKNSIANALARLGQLFDATACSLWRINPDESLQNITDFGGCECLGQWCAEEHSAIDEVSWLKNIALASPDLEQQLKHGASVGLLANDPRLKAAAKALYPTAVFSSLIVPVIRGDSLEGFIILHRTTTQGWFSRDSNRLIFIANALFIMHDRQKLVRQLSTRDTRFNYAIEASSDGLWDWNISTGKVYFSRGYLRMLGFQYEELPGNLTALCDYFLYRDDAKMVMDRYYAAIEKNETHVNLQFRMQHQNGKILWVQSKTKFCEPDANGRPTRCVGLNTNISDFIQTQEALMAAKIQADNANKTKSEFMARMSHEIRTPMNAIIGLGFLLKDTKLDPQQTSYLASLNSASDSLLYIINDVLDFSKIESGKVILEQANFDLNQLFEKIVRIFEISATDQKVRIIYDVKANVPRFLRGDAVRLSQVICHLINNALQYSKTSEVVVGVKLLAAKDKSVELEFSVTDFGIGMSADLLAATKEALHTHARYDDSRSNRFGLSICSHLISLMNGTIDIVSDVNRGCCVTFNACFDNSHLGARVLHTHNYDLKNIRILVVDDNSIARTVLTTTVKNLALNADSAESAAQAMEKINAASQAGKPYHFVLIDYKMPNMNGFEAAMAIKANQKLIHAPHIIIISAYHRDEISKVENNALAVDEFMSKPINEERLFEIITNVINSNKKLQDLSMETSDADNQNNVLDNMTVLIVEDNLVNQQVVKGILKKKNINIYIANNGLEALHLINQNTFSIDIILMDLEMPEMDGITATKAIRSGCIASDVPIVALTALAMRGDREGCIAAGMNAYLSKPINPEDLYQTLAEQISLHAPKINK